MGGRGWRDARVLVPLALGVTARVVLALVNWQANDDHLEIIRILADEGRVPGFDEHWQAYQPKLYHVSAALLWRSAALASDSVTPHARIVLAQLPSCAAGLLTLAAVAWLLRVLDVRSGAKRVAFALVALNPKLIAISAQATNDAFAIGFGALALAAAYAFLSRPGPLAWTVATLGAAAAVLSKGNGAVVPIAIGLAFVWAIARDGGRWWLPAVGFAAVVLALATAFGPYRAQYERSGSPFGINGPTQPFPHFFEETVARRPGVTSIAHSMLSFRPIALLHTPFVQGHPYVLLSRHRTSHWTQVYGRAHFAHFDEWPPAWRRSTPAMAALGRAILVLAAAPTLLIAVGAASRLRRAWRQAPAPPEALLWLAGAGYLAFSVAYALLQRDYSTMKAIFLLPAVPAFAAFFCWGAARVRGALAERRTWRALTRGGLAALLALYALDVGVLIGQLASVPREAREENHRTQLRAVLAVSPRHPDALRELGESLLEPGFLDRARPAEAVQQLEAASRAAAPGDPRALEALARAYAEIGDRARAESARERARARAAAGGSDGL